MITREQIIAAAKEADIMLIFDSKFGREDYASASCSYPSLERFYAIAYEAGKQAEREEIANWIDSTDCTKAPKSVAVWIAEMLHTYAEAIRARRTK